MRLYLWWIQHDNAMVDGEQEQHGTILSFMTARQDGRQRFFPTAIIPLGWIRRLATQQGLAFQNKNLVFKCQSDQTDHDVHSVFIFSPSRQPVSTGTYRGQPLMCCEGRTTNININNSGNAINFLIPSFRLNLRAEVRQEQQREEWLSYQFARAIPRSRGLLEPDSLRYSGIVSFQSLVDMWGMLDPASMGEWDLDETREGMSVVTLMLEQGVSFVRPGSSEPRYYRASGVPRIHVQSPGNESNFVHNVSVSGDGPRIVMSHRISVNQHQDLSFSE